jgi:hypothetical protein
VLRLYLHCLSCCRRQIRHKIIFLQHSVFRYCWQWRVGQQYTVFLFQCNSGYTNVPQRYVTRTVPLLYVCTLHRVSPSLRLYVLDLRNHSLDFIQRLYWHDCGLDDRLITIPDMTSYLISETSRTTLWLAQPPILWCQGSPSLLLYDARGKAAVAWSWPLTSEVKNECSYESTLLIWLHVVHRETLLKSVQGAQIPIAKSPWRLTFCTVAPRILRRLVDFWKICASLIGTDLPRQYFASLLAASPCSAEVKNECSCLYFSCMPPSCG